MSTSINGGTRRRRVAVGMFAVGCLATAGCTGSTDSGPVAASSAANEVAATQPSATSRAAASAVSATAQTDAAVTPTGSSAPVDSAAPTAPSSAAAPPTDSATTVRFVPSNADSENFDPALFAGAAPVANPWWPLVPGYQSVREGAVNKGSRRLPHRRVFTVTDATKQIAGVTATLVLDQDFDGGELAEQAIDYLAQDSGGNVWYLGSYTEAYEGGQFVNANDGWLAGVDGARAGVLMMADPQPGMPAYSQASVPDEGTVRAKVTKRGEQVCVPFKCYDDVLVIEEDGSENTFYAPGVGGIRLEPIKGDPQETEELVNLTQLSEQGTAELGDEAVRLDQHARTEVANVFGDSDQAKRPS